MRLPARPDQDYGWFEVWVDDTALPPACFFLLGSIDGKAFDICDPVDGTVNATFASYDEAMHWLTEDEFTRVDGRMSVE